MRSVIEEENSDPIPDKCGAFSGMTIASNNCLKEEPKRNSCHND